jgi:hypothetical protein
VVAIRESKPLATCCCASCGSLCSFDNASLSKLCNEGVSEIIDEQVLESLLKYLKANQIR